ncbi:hypothetical protein [Paraburkholderia bannensis]|uniref:hypothetical protein n=1 Tax=Paraburkholderia bannensis TaxID=765414 RepID=UPI0004878374|nr:hypothetical protein [Paraburkholderia bannensis]
MNARHGSLTASHNALVAVAAIAALWTSQLARAEGGTIHIVGEIVAPTFSITQKRAAQVEGLGVSNQLDSATGNTTVSFTNASSSMLFADVSTLDAKGARANLQPARLAATFTDGAGHRLQRGASGAYCVGASGGVLTLAPTAHVNNAQPVLVTVLTDYR